MSTVQTCAICGKMMDPNQWGQLHIIRRATGEETAIISGYEIVLKNAEAGDGKVDRVLGLV